MSSQIQSLCGELLHRINRFAEARRAFRKAFSSRRLPEAFHAYSDLEGAKLFKAVILSIHEEVQNQRGDLSGIAGSASNVVDLLRERLFFKPSVPCSQRVESAVYKALPKDVAINLAGLAANAGERLRIIEHLSDSPEPYPSDRARKIHDAIMELREDESPESMPGILTRWEQIFDRAEEDDDDFDLWSLVQDQARRVVSMAGHWLSFDEAYSCLRFVEGGETDCILGVWSSGIARLDNPRSVAEFVGKWLNRLSRRDAVEFAKSAAEIFAVKATDAWWSFGVELLGESMRCDEDSKDQILQACVRERIITLCIAGDWAGGEKLLEETVFCQRGTAVWVPLTMIAAVSGDEARMCKYTQLVEDSGCMPANAVGDRRLSAQRSAIDFFTGRRGVDVDSMLQSLVDHHRPGNASDWDYDVRNTELALFLVGRLMIEDGNSVNYLKVVDALYYPKCGIRVGWFLAELEAELERHAPDPKNEQMLKWHRLPPWMRAERWGARLDGRFCSVVPEKMITEIEAGPDITECVIRTLIKGVRRMVDEKPSDAVPSVIDFCSGQHLVVKLVLLAALHKILNEVGGSDERLSELIEANRMDPIMEEFSLELESMESGADTMSNGLFRPGLKTTDVIGAEEEEQGDWGPQRFFESLYAAVRSGDSEILEEAFSSAERYFATHRMSVFQRALVEDSVKWAEAFQCEEDASLRMGYINRMWEWYAGLEDADAREVARCFYGVELAAMGQIQRGMEMVAGISDARLRCEGLMKVAARRLVEHNDPSVCEIILNGIRGGDYSNQDIEDYVGAFADFAEICARFERADAFELIISAAGGVPHAFGGVGSGCALARLYVVSSAFGLERSWVDLLFRIAECGGAQVREIARKLLAEGIPLKNVTDEVRLKAAGVLVTVSGELNPHSAGEILWFVLARADAPADLIKELEQKFPDLAIGAGLLLEALEFGDFPFDVLTSLTRASEKDSAIQRQMLVRMLLDKGSFEDVFRIVKEESNLLNALVK